MHHGKFKRRVKVLLDTGPIIGLFNEQENSHESYKSFFGQAQFQYVVTEAVIGEVIYKLQKEKRGSRAIQAVVAFLKDVYDGRYMLYPLNREHMNRIKDLRNQYSDQKKLDFADLSLVVAAEDLTIGDIVTIDKKDFEKLRWGKTKYFTVIDPRSA